MRFDVVIPAFNAAATLSRAAASALTPSVQTVWIVDDCSTDDTFTQAQMLRRHDARIRLLRLPENAGAATARNWAAMHSQADYLAFLDADDAHQSQALYAAQQVFACQPQLGLLRLPIRPLNLPERYLHHPDFARAWRTFEMTSATNTVFRRNYFLALGGFPTHELFRRHGGEDGALGLATLEAGQVGTLFDEPADAPIGVNFYGHEAMHVRALLEAMLFHQSLAITPQELNEANAVTAAIAGQAQALEKILTAAPKGKQPFTLEWS